MSVKVATMHYPLVSMIDIAFGWSYVGNLPHAKILSW